MQQNNETTYEELVLAFQKEAYSKITFLGDLLNRLSDNLEDRSKLAQFRQEVHRIKGAGGCFGFGELSKAAASLESFVEELLHMNTVFTAQDIKRLSQGLDLLKAALSKGEGSLIPVGNIAKKVKILLVDDDETILKLISFYLQEPEYEVITADTQGHALKVLESYRPDIILVDILLPDGDGYQLTEWVKNQDNLKAIPVIFISVADQFIDKVKAVRVGGQGFLNKPFSREQLMDKVKQYTPLASSRKDKVLVVDDDPYLLEITSESLIKGGFEVSISSEPYRILETLKEVDPDLLVLDIEMPGINGIEACKAIRLEASFATLPILFLTGREDMTTKLEGFSAGANDYLIKPVEPLEMLARVSAQLQAVKLLRKQADRDGLTGLFNHRYFHQALEKQVRKSFAEAGVFSIIFFDLDNFKGINDHYGHQTGDEALKQFANFLEKIFGSLGIIARYGGDEFAVILPDLDKETSTRLLKVIPDENMLLSLKIHGINYVLQYSMGVVTFPEGKSPNMLLALADDRLYRAKSERKASELHFKGVIDEG